MNSSETVYTLVRYWMKGRFTRATAAWMVIGESFAVGLVLLVGGTFLSFSSRFNIGSGLSYVGLSLLFAFFLVGLVQSGFNGSGLPVSTADVDYVFTSPVSTSDIFIAKVSMNSFTTVLLSFPPILTLYLRFGASYGTSPLAALAAGLATLAFFVLALFFSADITLSLNSRLGARVRLVRNATLVAIAGISLLPLTLLIPEAPPQLAQAAGVLPSGLAARVSYSLVSGAAWGSGDYIDILLLAAWFLALFAVGLRLSRRNFLEVLQINDPDSEGDTLKDTKVRSSLKTEGRSLGAVVRAKERVIMTRTKEMRSLFVNALFLSGFMVIYSLSGVFQSSPTSFLFLLFIIGSFGSGNASRWLEKERLWLIKTSAIDLKRYVSEVYRARVTPLLLVLAPVAAAVGAPLLLEETSTPGSGLEIGLSLPESLEVAALMMAGGMYFAARYGQSSVDDTLATQGQDLADVKRFVYQTLINLGLVAPLMGFVLGAGPLLGLIGGSHVLLLAGVIGVAGLAYTTLVLRFILRIAGESLERREDL
ncbi:MAG: hypothetical protein OK456_05915 [Thaumarchaeota archaeon]|nr:hypothetical protein [Nitrososphaerota archaeon]